MFNVYIKIPDIFELGTCVTTRHPQTNTNSHTHASLTLLTKAVELKLAVLMLKCLHGLATSRR